MKIFSIMFKNFNLNRHLNKYLIRASQCLGVLPLNHDSPKTKLFDLTLIFLLSFLYLISILIISFMERKILKIEQCKDICYVSNLVLSYLSGFCYSISIYCCFSKQNFYVYFHKKISLIDNEFQKIESDKNIVIKSKTDYVQIIMFILCIICCGVVFIFDTHSNFLNMRQVVYSSSTDQGLFKLFGYMLLLSVSMCFPFLTSLLVQSQFALLMYEIAIRFEKINYVIELINKLCDDTIRRRIAEKKHLPNDELSNSDDDDSDIEMDLVDVEDVDQEITRKPSQPNEEKHERGTEPVKETEGYENVLTSLFSIHSELNELGVVVNKEYSTPIVTFMTTAFVITIFGIFMGTKVLFTVLDPNNVIIQITVSFVTWTVLFLIAAYLVLRLCSRATNESRVTAIEIHEVMQKKPDFMLSNDFYYNKMKCFTLQYLQWEHYYQYNGFGLFNLDYTFIFSAASAATSYLIVLLQFDLNTVI